MLAKRTIKMAQNRAYHLRQNLSTAASPDQFIINTADWRTEVSEYNHINELNSRQLELVRYLRDLVCRANNELYRIKNLPWWKRIWMA